MFLIWCFIIWKEESAAMKSRLNELDPDKPTYIFGILKPSLLTGGKEPSVNMQKLQILSKIM